MAKEELKHREVDLNDPLDRAIVHIQQVTAHLEPLEFIEAIGSAFMTTLVNKSHCEGCAAEQMAKLIEGIGNRSEEVCAMVQARRELSEITSKSKGVH